MGKHQLIGVNSAALHTGRSGRGISSLLMGLLALWWAFPAVAANDVSITTTLDEGQCTASVTNKTITLGDNGKIDPSSALGKSWVFLGKTNLNVTLACTAGLLSPTTKPALKIIPKAGTAQLGVAGLFASTTTGFGVVIGKTLAGDLTKTTLVTAAAPYVDLPSNASTGSSYALPVGLACGDTGDCTAAKLTAGNVSASFVVTFEYH